MAEKGMRKGMDGNIQVTIPVNPWIRKLSLKGMDSNIQVTIQVNPRIRKLSENGDGQQYASDHPS